MCSKRAGYVYLNDVPTRVVTWGKWIEESFEYEKNKELILFIPGNPGVTAFYEIFLATIYEKVRTPVWIVGHSGHEKPTNPEDYSIPDPKEHRNKFDLDTQIKNKMLFIEKYIPMDVKIHLVGHSVGTYTILHLLEHENIKQRVTNVEMKLLDAIVKFVDPYVLQNVFVMAYDQFGTVRERPNDKLRKNWDSIKFYYGRTDNWVPDLAPVNLKRDIPHLDVEICKTGVEHTFVLKHSKEMGEIVADWLSVN
ncbi:hypothetical protein Trydic_g3091 [Trypoxylus dichotomus]